MIRWPPISDNLIVVGLIADFREITEIDRLQPFLGNLWQKLSHRDWLSLFYGGQLPIVKNKLPIHKAN